MSVLIQSSVQHQRGVVSLLAAIVLTFLVGIVTLVASRFLVFEQVISGNQLRSAQAFEAAQAGLERGVAWLQTRSASPAVDNWGAANTSACKENTAVGSNGVYSIYSLAWGGLSSQRTRVIDAASTCNLNMPTTFTVTMGAITYDVTLSYIQTLSNLSDIGFVTVSATAVSQDTAKGGSARVEQVVSLPGGPPGTGGLADAPIVVKGCLTGVTGNPDICPANVAPGNTNIQGGGSAPDCAAGSGSGPTGVAVVSLANTPSNPAACLPLDNNNIKPHGGTMSFKGTPSATVWETLFPNNRLTEAMVKTLSESGLAGFKYYDSSNAPNKIPAQGTATQPVLVYVDSSAGCIPLAPGDFFALVYFETTANCDLQGGGSVDLTGSIAVEGSITKFNANTIIRNSGFTGDWQDDVAEGAKIFSRVPGTWRDFQ